MQDDGSTVAARCCPARSGRCAVLRQRRQERYAKKHVHSATQRKNTKKMANVVPNASASLHRIKPSLHRGDEVRVTRALTCLRPL